MDRPTIFLDKDGTLVEDIPYNVDPNQMILEKGAAQGLQKLARAGFRLVVVSNQSGVARGYFKEEALETVKNHLRVLVEQGSGAFLDGFYYCPHHPDGSIAEYAIDCSCRKPQPGMLLRAAEALGINLNSAWMVGDILDDVEAGRRAGCHTILIDNGHETEWKQSPFRTPDFTAANLDEAADIILSETGCQAAPDVPAASQEGKGK